MKRILIASVVLLAVTNLAPCQDSLNMVRLGSLFNYNSAARKMDRLGNVLYICQSDSGVSLVDVSDPFQPQKIGDIRSFTPSFNVIVRDSLIFIAADSELVILDTSAMNNHQAIGNLRFGEYIQGLFKQDSILYVAGTKTGLKVINVADPRDPQMIDSLRLDRGAWNISIYTDLAFVSGFARLYILDISDPEDPSEVSRMDMSFGFPGICIYEDILYVADFDGGLKVFDIQDPSDPQLIGHFRTRDIAVNVEVSGSIAYVAAGDFGLQVLDVSDIEHITEVGYYDTPGSAEELIVGDSGLVYLGDYTNLGIYRYIPENGISTDEPILHPVSFMFAAFPNPFNSVVTIAYQLPRPGAAEIAIYDALGRRVALVASGWQTAGRHFARWESAGIASGAYVCSITTPLGRSSQRVVMER